MRWRRNAVSATVSSGPIATDAKASSAARDPTGNAPAAVPNARIKATVNGPAEVPASAAGNGAPAGRSLTVRVGRAVPVVSCGCFR